MAGRVTTPEQMNNVYTVSRLTRELRGLLESAFNDILVEGEISNFKVYPSGHAYFSLKDRESILSCVMFKSGIKKVKVEVEDGVKVICRGHISVYDKRGQYQLYVSRIDPVGRGDLQAAFERLKKKLFEEGLFAEDAKKRIPALPARIGVVTSQAGAAIRDILNVARRRYPNVHITLLPVKVQGDGAAEEIAAAINGFNEYNNQLTKNFPDEQIVDVIIVGRGGGSLEDLWAFNEEVVARAIYASEIPVISAVGHEIDYTISDLVADMRAPTPSAAAELCVPRKQDLEKAVEARRKDLKEAGKRFLENAQKRLDSAKGAYVLKEPTNVLDQLGQQIDDMARAAAVSLRHGMEIREKELALVSGKLGALSPLAVLERGYSITFKGGRIVKAGSELVKGDLVETRVSAGSFTSRVENVLPQNKAEDK